MSKIEKWLKLCDEAVDCACRDGSLLCRVAAALREACAEVERLQREKAVLPDELPPTREQEISHDPTDDESIHISTDELPPTRAQVLAMVRVALYKCGSWR